MSLAGLLPPWPRLYPLRQCLVQARVAGKSLTQHDGLQVVADLFSGQAYPSRATSPNAGLHTAKELGYEVRACHWLAYHEVLAKTHRAAATCVAECIGNAFTGQEQCGPGNLEE